MNKINFYNYFLLSITFSLCLSSCGQKSIEQASVEPVVVENQPESEPQTKGTRIINEHEYQQGIDALRILDYDKAKRLFSRFIQNNPSLSGAYVNLALIAFHEEDYVAVDKLTRQAIDLNPNQAPAYHLRAQLQLKKGKIKLAREDYLKAIELRPDYSNAHYNLALLYDIYLQEIALAIEHYSIYLSLLDKEDLRTQEWISHLRNTLENG